MKKGVKRFLAGLCTTMMLSQTVLDSGFVLYASAGEDAVVIEAPAETADEAVASENDAAGEEETVAASENDAAEEETAVVSENDAKDASEETGKTGDDSQEKDVEVPGEEINYARFTLQADGSVMVGGTKYGTFKDGVFTVSKAVPLIPGDVFNQWEELEKINFESGSKVKVIQAGLDGAFRECHKLAEIDFSNAADLTTIERYAFSGCENLSTINFHEKLQYIEDNAFSDCVSLNSVVLKKELVSLGSSAFKGCKNLKKVRIEATNLSMENSDNVFAECSINAFELESSDPKKNEIVPANLFKGAGFEQGAVIKIQSEVKEIGASAFEGSNINYVQLPDGLTTIADRAFYNCESLKEINLNKVQKIGYESFYHCADIKELVIPDNVTRIGDGAFKYCSALSDLTLGQGTTSESSLGSSIFEGCESLTSVEIPSPHTYVGEAEFRDCFKLQDVKFSSTVTKIGNYAFTNCVSLMEITLPSNAGFTTIPEGCFSGCASLIYVLIDDDTDGFREGITTIDNGAFEDCVWLNTNSFPKTLTYIGRSAFKNCISIKDLVIPERVQHIGESAFQNCTGINVVTLKSNVLDECEEKIFYLDYLREINFPEGVDTIPANLFNQATWVTDRNIVIPNTVVTVGAGAFRGGDDEKTSNFLSITFQPLAGGGYNVQYIGDNAFRDCRAISSFTIPDSVTFIGESAFSGCSKLESILIPENVTELGGYAFSRCSILSSISYNAIAVTTANWGIFEGCNVKKITIGPNVRLFPDNLFRDANFAEATENDEIIEVKLRVPATCERIGAYSLPNIINLKEIVFDSGSVLKEIGEYGISGCKNMTTCVLPDTVETIETGAFNGDEALKDFHFPAALTTLGAESFVDCKQFTEVTINNKLTEIHDGTFRRCTGLTKVEFEAGSVVERIGSNAFEDCTGLTSISIPASVRTVANSAFIGCNKIKAVTFASDGVMETFEDSAFESCPIVGTLDTPENLSSIGSKAFYTTGRDGMTEVYLYDLISYVGENAFNIAYKNNLHFHVVKGPAEDWLIENGFEDCIVESSGKADNITITFDLNGHGDEFTRIVKSGNPLSRPDDPVAEGFEFGGWFTEKACKNLYDFDKEVTKEFTLYAKWSEKAHDIAGGNSALDPVPEIKADTTDLWLVKGQKFNIGKGWTPVDKNSKKYVTISKAGVFKAKKVTTGDEIKIHHDGREDITIHISQPQISKKMTFEFTNGDPVNTQNAMLFKDEHITNVVWYSSAPDVATVDDKGEVTAVGKGSAKISAYINGTAYTCKVTVKEKVAAKERTIHMTLGGKAKTISLKKVKAVWTSSDPEIARIDGKKGNKVVALKAGTVDLTATANAVDYKITLIVEDITLTGSESLSGGTKNKYKLNLTKGTDVDLAFTSLDPERVVVFKSSKPDVAYIDENGHVVARGIGTTKFTTKINGSTITIDVTVQ